MTETWPTSVIPLFTPGVHARFADVYAIITEQFDNEVEEDLSWEERSQDRAVWRGQPSGPMYDSESPWISTQRPRLHLMSKEQAGERELVLADANDVARTSVVQNEILNPAFLDTGVVGPPTQCVFFLVVNLEKKYVPSYSPSFADAWWKMAHATS